MSAPTCTCGHLVVDDRRCACIGYCRECSMEDCCAETWALWMDDPSLFMGPNGERADNKTLCQAEGTNQDE